MSMDKVDFFKGLSLSKDLDYIYSNVKDIFEYNVDGTPKVVDGEILYWAYKALEHTTKEMENELMYKRFYHNSHERYEEYVQKDMIKIEKGAFLMGTASDAKIKYCGEEPQHKVTLDTYCVSNTLVSEDLYSKYNPFYEKQDTTNDMPANNVSWYDAVMFSKWIDCRLLTEAEWEYASKSNSTNLWCCEKEEDLKKYGWYSENSDGYIHPLKKLLPNSNGLYDLHGNVWEWCQDSYEEEYYSKSPSNNPVNTKDILDKVCKGGSIHAFSEMCRCSFRDYEPANFKAIDIGFRLARNKK